MAGISLGTKNGKLVNCCCPPPPPPPPEPPQRCPGGWCLAVSLTHAGGGPDCLFEPDDPPQPNSDAVISFAWKGHGFDTDSDPCGQFNHGYAWGIRFYGNALQYGEYITELQIWLDAQTGPWDDHAQTQVGGCETNEAFIVDWCMGKTQWDFTQYNGAREIFIGTETTLDLPPLDNEVPGECDLEDQIT